MESGIKIMIGITIVVVGFIGFLIAEDQWSRWFGGKKE